MNTTYNWNAGNNGSTHCSPSASGICTKTIRMIYKWGWYYLQPLWSNCDSRYMSSRKSYQSSYQCSHESLFPSIEQNFQFFLSYGRFFVFGSFIFVLTMCAGCCHLCDNLLFTRVSDFFNNIYLILYSALVKRKNTHLNIHYHSGKK